MSIVPKPIKSKLLNPLDSSRPIGRLSLNVEAGGFRELFLPENDCKTCSLVNVPKINPDFGGLETNQRHETQAIYFFFHMPFYK